MLSTCGTRYVAHEVEVLLCTELLLLHRCDCAAAASRTTTTIAFSDLRQPRRYSSNAHALTHLALASRLRRFLSKGVSGQHREAPTF